MHYYHVSKINYLVEQKLKMSTLGFYYSSNLKELAWLEKKLELQHPSSAPSRKFALHAWKNISNALSFRRMQCNRSNIYLSSYKIYEVEIINRHEAVMDIIDYLAVQPQTFDNFKKAIAEYWNPTPNKWSSIELLCTELTIKKKCNKFSDVDCAEGMLNGDPQRCNWLWG
jgi:hypothetical protein